MFSRILWWSPGVILLLVLIAGADRLAAGTNNIPFSEGLLFEVGKDGSDPGFIFGTIHSEDPRVVELPPAVQAAFDGSSRFAMEVLMDATNLLESMTAMLLDNGRLLEDIIGPRLYLETVEAVTALGYPAVTVRHFKPWAVVSLLSVPPPVTGRFLDLRLYQRALEEGKEMVGLETVAEQVITFDSLTEDEQIRLLRSTLRLRHQLPELYDELLEAYLRRDLRALVELNDRQLIGDDRAVAERLKQGVIDNRNGSMVQEILPLLQRGGVFVAIGALHLPGRQGVLELLRQEGYGVRRVY